MLGKSVFLNLITGCVKVKACTSNDFGSNALLNKLGKREMPKRVCPPAKKTKSSTSSIKVGEYVCIYSDRLDKHHVPCRVVQVVGKKYQLYCHKGVLKRTYITVKNEQLFQLILVTSVSCSLAFIIK